MSYEALMPVHEMPELLIVPKVILMICSIHIIDLMGGEIAEYAKSKEIE